MALFNSWKARDGILLSTEHEQQQGTEGSLDTKILLYFILEGRRSGEFLSRVT